MADKWVEVEVLRAISIGGVRHAPGSKAVITEERATAHGAKDVKVLGPAGDPAGKQAESPADKQVTGAANK